MSSGKSAHEPNSKALAKLDTEVSSLDTKVQLVNKNPPMPNNKNNSEAIVLNSNILNRRKSDDSTKPANLGSEDWKDLAHLNLEVTFKL